MIVKVGSLKILDCVFGDLVNGMFTEYNLDVVQKTTGNYNEVLIRKSSVMQVQYTNGAESGRNFVESSGYTIYPNTSLDSALNAISAGTRNWVSELTEV